jgi:hypothetical protein
VPKLKISFAGAAMAKPIGGEMLRMRASRVLTSRSHSCPCVRASGESRAEISSATRIMLRKGRGDERIAKLQDSPDQPEGEATYALKSG